MALANQGSNKGLGGRSRVDEQKVVIRDNLGSFLGYACLLALVHSTPRRHAHLDRIARSFCCNRAAVGALELTFGLKLADIGADGGRGDAEAGSEFGDTYG